MHAASSHSNGAHSLEARVPVLDLDVIRYAMSLPAEWTHLREDAGGPGVQKWILRRAFVGYLPDSILWRKKRQFGDGSGMKAAPEGQGARVDRAAWGGGVALRNAEEAACYAVFDEAYPGSMRRLGDAW